ncbi:MAG: hypothetical protein CR961_01450 [Polaribacter sp.]|nr:MAG: hypothetical protein CR961_01450 [Polaribacter sp.]
MELTTEQIQQIDNYLNNKGLNYIDIRTEVFDHIASDIEAQIDKGVSFEKALNLNTKKWDNDLKSTSSWIVGWEYSRPKIVINKAKKEVLYLSLFILFSAILFGFTIDIETSFMGNFYRSILLYFTIFITIANFIFYLIMRKNKVKTTYLFLFEKRVFFNIPFLILMATVIKKDSVFLFYSILAIGISLFGINLFRKHQKILKL